MTKRPWNRYAPPPRRQPARSWWVTSGDAEFTTRSRTEAQRMREQPAPGGVNDYIGGVEKRDARQANLVGVKRRS